MPASLRYRVESRPVVTRARHAVSRMAADLGLDRARREAAELVAGELAANLLVHGGGGLLVAQASLDGAVLEVLAMDRGQGILDLDRCLRGGYSSVGSGGAGLSLVRTLADSSAVRSWPGRGTVVVAGFGRPVRKQPGTLEVGGLLGPDFGDLCYDPPRLAVGDAARVDFHGGRGRCHLRDDMCLRIWNLATGQEAGAWDGGEHDFPWGPDLAAVLATEEAAAAIPRFGAPLFSEPPSLAAALLVHLSGRDDGAVVVALPIPD